MERAVQHPERRSKHLAMNLSDDELTVLLIAAKGEPMLAIGRWEEPTKNLILKGYLRPCTDKINNIITDAGRKAAREAEDAPFKALIEIGSKVGATQKAIRDFAEQAAQLLAQAAKTSHDITGDAPEYAAEKWSGIILRRAKEILRG